MICSVLGGPLYHLPCHTVPLALVGGVLIRKLLLTQLLLLLLVYCITKCTQNTDITEIKPGRQWPALYVQYVLCTLIQ
jgi:hypothetical protein